MRNGKLRRWTKKHLRTARKSLRAGKSAKKVARLLGRSEGALRQKLWSEGISTRRTG